VHAELKSCLRHRLNVDTSSQFFAQSHNYYGSNTFTLRELTFIEQVPAESQLRQRES